MSLAKRACVSLKDAVRNTPKTLRDEATMQRYQLKDGVDGMKFRGNPSSRMPRPATQEARDATR